MPKHLAVILAATAFAAAAWSLPATAAATAPHRVSMHPSALTLRGHPHARARGNHRYHNHVHNTFNQPPHTHGTMAGPRM